MVNILKVERTEIILFPIITFSQYKFFRVDQGSRTPSNLPVTYMMFQLFLNKEKRNSSVFTSLSSKFIFYPVHFLSVPPLRKKNCPFSQLKLIFPSILWNLLPRDLLFRVISVLLLISRWLLNIITYFPS